MSQTVDERVVEMRFDNKQFESGAKETMNTLERLKEKLKMTDSTKGLEEIDKAAQNIHLEGIAAGVEALQERFSTLGIVGMRVIERLTDTVFNTLGKAVDYVTDSIVSGGLRRATNIENAHFQLQALLKDEVRVQAVMANAMTSVDGTAYAYDEAAKAASQFAASGLKAGDEMLSALRGIVGVAAMTNSEYEGVARIFTTVAGNGRIMGDQLLQLASRGLNAAATMADYFNKVNSGAVDATDSVKAAIKELSLGKEVTEGMIRDFISSKNTNISFEVFSAAMTDAFAESAERANETFTGALSNVKSALARIGAEFFSPLIEQNSDLVGLLNTLRVKINSIKSEVAYNPRTSLLSGLAEQSSKTEAAWTRVFDLISERGVMAERDIQFFTTGGVPVLTKIGEYLNGVADGSVRATYAMTNAVKSITNGASVSAIEVKKMISDGLITIDILEAAMDEAYGNQRSLSHDFTEWFLDTIKKVSEKIQNIDFSKPMDVFYSVVNITKNAVKGLLSVLSPVATAFSNAFLSFNIDDVRDIASSIEQITSRMRLSEENSDNLRRALTGVFNVMKLGVDILIKFVRAFIPIKQPVDSMSSSMLDFAGNVGDLLTAFTEWVRQSPNIKKAYDIVSTAISSCMGFLAKAITKVYEFGKSIYNLPGVQKLIEGVINSFKKLGTLVAPYLDKVSERLGEFTKKAGEIIPKKVNNLLEKFADKIEYLFEKISEFNFSSIKDGFDSIVDSIGKFFGQIASGLPSLATFVGYNPTISNLTNSFLSLGDSANNGLTGLKEKLMGFFNWIKEKFFPMFEKLDIGSVATIATGIATVIGSIKIADTLKSGLSVLSKIPKAFSSVLNQLRDTLKAYQTNLEADTLKKIAGAILIFAASIAVLSLLDADKVMKVSVLFGAASSAIIVSLSKLVEALGKLHHEKTKEDVLYKFAQGIKKALGAFAAGVSAKLIGSAIRDIAISVGLVVGLIALVAYLFKSNKIDKESINEALNLVGLVSAAVIGIIAVFALLGDHLTKAAKNLALVGVGFIALGASIFIIALAINKLFKIELPSDWGEKLFILGSIMVTFGILGALIARAGKDSEKSVDMSPLLTMAASIYLMMFAVNKLFKIELPSDWGEKLLVLGLIFVAYMALIAVIGKATSGEHNPLKATGELLTISLAFVKSVTDALEKLADIDTKKLLVGTGVIAAILLALGASFKMMGEFNAEHVGTAVAGLSALIGVLATTLGALSLIPFGSLMKATVSLGIVLAALAANLYALSKMQGDQKIKGNLIILSGVILILAGVLSTMSSLPWEGVLASGASMSALLLSFAVLLRKISSSSGIKMEKILLFGLATSALLPIAGSLALLANQPWDGLLAAGISLSIVLYTFSEVLKRLSAMRGIKTEKIVAFGLAVVSLMLIAASLQTFMEATKDISWDHMLVSATTLSGVLLAFSLAFSIMSSAKPDVASIAAFVAASASLLLVSASIGMLVDYDWQSLLGAAGAISIVLLAMSAAMAVCAVIGNVAAPAITGLLVLDAFVLGFAALMGLLSLFPIESIEKGAETLKTIGKAVGDFLGSIVGGFIENTMAGITAALPKMGKDLSDFWDNAQSFFDGMGNVKSSTFDGIKYLADAMFTLTKNELLDSLMFWKKGGSDASIFTTFGKQLTEFAPYLIEFSNLIAGINGSDVEQAAIATELLSNVANKLPYDKTSLLGEIMGKISLAEFGSWLISKDENGLGYGEAISKFAEQVKDVDSSAVEGAAAATEIMAEVANKLPYDKASLMGQLFGRISLAEFGEQLVGSSNGGLGFGESIALFAEQVKDVKESHVKGAAAAATLMAEVANKLPYADDTLMQKLFGKVSLSEFALELLAFAPSLKIFTMYTNGITEDSVKGAANAASVLAEMANNLPSTDTLWDKIFGGGTQSLSSFGTELESYGRSLYEFSRSIQTVNYNKIQETIKITKDLVSLFTGGSFDDMKSSSNEINVSGGLFSIFVSKLTDVDPLKDFANNLTSLGKTLTDFYDIISTISAVRMEEVIQSLRDIVEILPVIKSLNPEDYASKFEKLGDMGINKFMEIFRGSSTKVAEAVMVVIDATGKSLREGRSTVYNNAELLGEASGEGFKTGILSKQQLVVSVVTTICTSIIAKMKVILVYSTFVQIAQNAIQGLITGLNSKRQLTIETTTSICFAIVTVTKKELDSSVFGIIGSNIGIGLGDGILSQNGRLLAASEKVCATILNAFRINLNAAVFSVIGSNIADGICSGVESKVSDIVSSMTIVANSAINATKKTLDINSPSKVAYSLGEFWDIGLASGILSRVADVSNAGDVTAQNVINPIRDAVSTLKEIIDSEDFDDNRFTITPILDLSDIRSGASELNNLFTRRLDISANYVQASDILDLMNQSKTSKTKKRSQSSEVDSFGSVFNFYQTNNSPKALSESEIYRQTNNQFSAFKRAVQKK